jgi:two-component system sensor histidine kinase PhoQ
MLSLKLRVLIAASIVLVSFFGIAGATLDRTYYLTAEKALQDHLLSRIYTLIATTSIDEKNRLSISQNALDVLYFIAGPEMYARISENDGDVVWQSPMLKSYGIPFTTGLLRNEANFSIVGASDGKRFATMSYGVGWDDRVSQHVFIFSFAENLQSFEEQVTGFRRMLWGWLGGVGLVLLIVQGMIMRWGLAPLQGAAGELAAIEAGNRSRLERNYPGELRALTHNINALLDHQNEHLERYRHTLGDLAHSLKTPLAVLQSAVEKPVDVQEFKAVVQEQLNRMNQITEYQLQRAATAGQLPLGAPVGVKALVDKIMASLQKVYADKAVRMDVKISPSLEFHGDAGDLMEVFGNLIDNAFKWCDSTVVASARDIESQDIIHHGIEVTIEDDGPGIPTKRVQQVTQRGVRADQGISGHGIGLSIVQDIVQLYGGSMQITNSDYGGASIRIRLLTRY